MQPEKKAMFSPTPALPWHWGFYPVALAPDCFPYLLQVEFKPVPHFKMPHCDSDISLFLFFWSRPLQFLPPLFQKSDFQSSLFRTKAMWLLYSFCDSNMAEVYICSPTPSRNSPLHPCPFSPMSPVQRYYSLLVFHNNTFCSWLQLPWELQPS